MARYRTFKPTPELYHYSKDKKIRGKIYYHTDKSLSAYIEDNRPGMKNKVLLIQLFGRKEIREANTWMYEHLDCPLFTLLQSNA